MIDLFLALKGAELRQQVCIGNRRAFWFFQATDETQPVRGIAHKLRPRLARPNITAEVVLAPAHPVFCRSRDLGHGHKQWLKRCSDAVIPEKIAHKILKAADQILKAGATV